METSPRWPFKSLRDSVINQAVGDLINDYSTEHFRFAIGELRKVVAPLVVEDSRTDQQRARHRILGYLDLYLKRANLWAEEESDLMAVVMRGLIELRFWTTYVSESEVKAKHFIDEAMIDRKDIHDRVVKLRPPEWEPPPEPPNAVGKRVRVGPDDGVEELTWKLSSKLIHPSSWSINHFDETMGDPDMRNLFAVQVVMYAWEIVNSFHNIEWLD